MDGLALGLGLSNDIEYALPCVAGRTLGRADRFCAVPGCGEEEDWCTPPAVFFSSAATQPVLRVLLRDLSLVPLCDLVWLNEWFLLAAIPLSVLRCSVARVLLTERSLVPLLERSRVGAVVGGCWEGSRDLWPLLDLFFYLTSFYFYRVKNKEIKFWEVTVPCKRHIYSSHYKGHGMKKVIVT